MKSLLSLGVLVGVVLMASLAASFPARLGRNHVADEGCANCRFVLHRSRPALLEFVRSCSVFCVCRVACMRSAARRNCLAIPLPFSRAAISRCSWYRGVPSAGAGQQLWKQRPESTASAGEDSWDYFLFVQTSPAGDCYFEVSFSPALKPPSLLCFSLYTQNDANCAYPANSTQWTMHGIW